MLNGSTQVSAILGKVEKKSLRTHRMGFPQAEYPSLLGRDDVRAGAVEKKKKIGYLKKKNQATVIKLFFRDEELKNIQLLTCWSILFYQ